MTKPVGAAPGAAGAAGALEAGEDGAFADRLVSHTSLGSTVANSRRTRSQKTRRERAAVSAATRAFCSVASPASTAVSAAGSGGSTFSLAVASPSSCRLPVTDEVAERNMTERAIATTSRRPSPARIGAFSAGVRLRRSSRGRRLTARTLSVLDPEADRDRERARLLRLAQSPADLDAGERIAHPDLYADQPLEILGEPFEVRRAAGQDDLADAERAR